eukprot:CAMPEP_0115848728 /NCGR_PEP_ID=MMETSP0287-20121206/11077_1 /TAXON_ID=412157 /ORGANISM="Chrysochromulina rotalis, Strain UIO044" /LENGTH=297 /DNA_ID=CAMNT_0003302661 /DNA_START=12 /DNA_END=907 /DNA_ORIENTATION=+
MISHGGRPAVVVGLLLQFTCSRAPLKLTSSFSAGQDIPYDYRGDEDNISPPLKWTGAPKNTESFVLIVDSASDASGKVESQTHWVVYDIPKEVNEMREELSGAGASEVPRLGMKEDAGQAPVVVDPMGSMMGDGYVDPEIKAMQDMIHSAVDASFEDRNRAKEGSNSFGTTYYNGPKKTGTTMTFKLYALSGRLEIARASSREEVIAAMKGKVLGKASLAARVPEGIHVRDHHSPYIMKGEAPLRIAGDVTTAGSRTTEGDGHTADCGLTAQKRKLKLRYTYDSDTQQYYYQSYSRE